MKVIQIDDVLTLDDDNEYVVVKTLDLNEESYLLLSKLDDDEVTSETLIVKENSDNTLSHIKDENLLYKLNDLFISALK